MGREDESRGRTRDAEGRLVRLLDPYPLWLRGRFEPIAETELNAIVNDLGVPNKGRKTIYLWLGFIAVVLVLTVGGIAAMVMIEGRPAVNDLLSMLRNPAMWIGPIGGTVAAIIATRQQRLAKMRRVLLGHGHCPHCGYRIVGLPTGDEAVRCPECSCTWPSGEVGAAVGGMVAARPAVSRTLVWVGVALTVLAVAGTVTMMLV